ncbi:hypothetical protein ACHAWF_003592 [Thalassiosira exigua]
MNALPTLLIPPSPIDNPRAGSTADRKRRSSTGRMARRHRTSLLLPLAVAASSASAAAAPPSEPRYRNATLRSPIMSARVFTPPGPDPRDDSSTYYLGTRFEHGSMIGDVVYDTDRTVYGRGLWRTPHDPRRPESGVGLASEFGCGDDGSRCAGKGDITNGVLGYDEAADGEPFLKIGVGALIKGSCPDCAGDVKGTYRFNSPYKFHRRPHWKVLPSPGPNEVTFYGEERLNDYGYSLQKTVRLDGNVLTVRSLLTNVGTRRFTTPWYSHHFFAGDDVPVGPGYELDLGLSEYALETPTPRYKQPGLGTWSDDVRSYANVTLARDGSISLKLHTTIPPGVRIKAEFLDEKTITLTDGSFALRAPNGVEVIEKIPELQTQSRNPFIYAYDVYAERGTLSPEPMLLLYLQPGETTFWTQHLKFSADGRGGNGGDTGGGGGGATTTGGNNPFLSMFAKRAWPGSSRSWPSVISARLLLIAACLGAVAASYASRFDGSRRRRRTRSGYAPVPDRPPKGDEGVDALPVV